MILLAGSLIATGANGVFAASDRCTVIEADGNRLILECRKETETVFNPGSGVKIKTDRKRGSMEGC